MRHYYKFLALICILILTTNSKLYAQPFSDAHLIDAANGATYSTTADLDNDGDLDVISYILEPNSIQDKIVWFENDGLGHFSKPKNIINLKLPIYFFFYGDPFVPFLIGDIDSDNDNDIVVYYKNTDEDTSYYKWYENNGNEQFNTMHNILTTPFDNPSYSSDGVVALTDMNGDNNLDVVGLNNTWFQNDGNGNFIAQSNIFPNTSEEFPSPLVYNTGVVDVDLDGDIDIVNKLSGYNYHLFEALCMPDSLFWFENDGNGNFQKRTIIGGTTFWDGGYCITTSILSANLVDIEDDGDKDLMVTTTSSGIPGGSSIYVNLYKNDGMGNFSFYKSILELPAQTIFVQFPIRLDLVDINSDNHKDIIIDNSYEYFYYLNDGNDNFSIKQTLPLRETFDSPYLFSYLFEDLNGDNHPDFLYNSIGFNTSLSEINYSLSDANGVQHFNNYQNVHGDSLYYSKNIHSNDIDNDGDNDIVFYFYNRIGWYKNKGNGSFESPYFLETGVNYINQVELADVNNNGNVDILYTYNDNNIAYYKNNGNGNFTSQSLVNIIDSITAIHSIDIDNDGFNDILFSNSNKLAWYKNDGNNIFSTENIISITDTFNNCTLLSNDVNNDGHIDIISAVNGGKLLWYQNNGSGSFSAPQIITNNCNYTEIYSTDVDNDSSIDLIYNIPNTSNLTWFKNDGNGIFNSIDITTGANPIKAFTIADIDRDGTNNIVCLTQNNTTILSKDDSTGLFTVAYTIVNDITDDYLHSILTPDIDGDGISDLLISSIVQLFWRQNLIEKPLIKAIAFYDENNNGVQDGSERLLNFAEILVAPNELGVFTSSDGYALFVLDTGAYVISAIIDTNWMQTTIPEVYNLDLSNYNTTDTLYFGFTPKHLINDLKFTNIAQANTRCARDIPFQITYTNTGTTKLNGYVTVTEENLITYVDSPNNTPTDSTSGSERFWFFDDLYPTESKTIIQYYTVADQSFAGDTLTLSAQAVVPVLYNNATAYHNNTGSTTTDKVTICHCTAADNDHYVVLEVPLSAIDSFGYNDYIFYDCDIVPITDIDGDGDIDTDDCKAKKPSYDEIAINGPFYSLIFCSFDPNDKQANPKGEGENNLTYKDEDIIYIIRFQNTGNDTAFHVQITDSLDKNLDINTFKFIAASHSNLQIQKQTYNIGTANEYHELSFTFHPIILPDSATNEVASQGFVSFSIKPKKDLPENTVINNTANIVFDKFTNYPVITNTVTNTLVSNLRVTTAILEKKYDVGINAYPNPFNSMVNIELSKPSTQQSVDISIVNIEGKRLKVLTNITNNNINIDLSSIATGAYFIAVEDTQTKELIGIKKIVKQ